MTDKRMLIQAAKAAGYEIDFDEPVNGWFVNGYDENGDPAAWWNPLLDDGDAFRLAVKLGIYFMVVSEQNEVCARVRNGIRTSWREKFWKDPCAATRIAIVRAAAELGGAE